MLEPISFITDLFTLQGSYYLFSWFLLFFQVFYLLFAIIEIQRISTLNATLSTPAAGFFRFLTYINLFLALGVFVLSLLLL